MSGSPAGTSTHLDAVSAYKSFLCAIIDRRPSGTRQRLATALSRNRSFVSQIINPAYSTPIPARHIASIFDVCHLSALERQEFMRLYALAHPAKMLPKASDNGAPAIQLPDLGDSALNGRLQLLVSTFVSDLAKLIDDKRENGRRR